MSFIRVMAMKQSYFTAPCVGESWRIMQKISTFGLLTPFINPFSNDEVLAVSCKDDPRATICTSFGISPDEYSSFMCFECMKCHKKETIYFNCTSDVMEDLAKMIGANNERNR